ncbi:MAG: copper resistance protein NlpE N-terminal domain-containing protein [Bacteroidaceae bacterium]|nr:copper resistance protein NlpE N-terminal domain-containing protein [Bacteroidaceae bacterium]MBR2416838.1 copper resistance protein NlpE N-terminal domain-containing protein [Bacteroidaceae bacterium]
MKKLIPLTAVAAVLLFASCNSCGNCNKPQGIMIESDSLYMVNDSTIADAQTFIYEGTLPMTNGNIGDVLLTIQTVSLNEDGTYTITTDYVNEALADETDNGEVMVMIGMPTDSTAIIYELVSANGNPKMNLMLSPDSSLVKLDSKMKPASMNPAHKLVPKKQ